MHYDRMGERERPWRDRETLREYWYESDLTIAEMSDGLGCAPSTIHRWVEEFGFDRREEKGGPWTDRDTLMELYWDLRLPQSEIAEMLGCNQATISRWFGIHDIPARHLSKEYGNLFTDQVGNEKFCVDGEYVIIHRLLAVSEYGFEAVKDNDVHHKNRIRWDNRPGNIEVLTPSEHSQLHVPERVAARWPDR